MTTLRQGDRGPAVRELQLLLAMTGYDPGPIDGVFGPRTARAVCAYDHPGSACNEPIADEATVTNLRGEPRRAVEAPRVLTPIAAVDMRIALACGYAATFAMDTDVVPREPIRVALAQLCVEHGCGPWGGATWHDLEETGCLPPAWLCPSGPDVQTYIYVWNNNIGNRQVSGADRANADVGMGHGPPLVPWFSMSPVEGSGTSAHRAPSAHYAYPIAAEGAAAYWRFLRDCCGPALAAFEAGDPAAAAHELKVGAWRYSGDEAEYTRAMVDRFRGIE